MQNKVELFDRGPGQKMGCIKLLKNQQMGCKLLEIMADGLYAVFHRFEAFLKKG